VHIAGDVGLLDKEFVSEIVAELKYISAILHKAAITIKQRLNT